MGWASAEAGFLRRFQERRGGWEELAISVMEKTDTNLQLVDKQLLGI